MSSDSPPDSTPAASANVAPETTLPAASVPSAASLLEPKTETEDIGDLGQDLEDDPFAQIGDEEEAKKVEVEEPPLLAEPVKSLPHEEGSEAEVENQGGIEQSPLEESREAEVEHEETESVPEAEVVPTPEPAEEIHVDTIEPSVHHVELEPAELEPAPEPTVVALAEPEPVVEHVESVAAPIETAVEPVEPVVAVDPTVERVVEPTEPAVEPVETAPPAEAEEPAPAPAPAPVSKDYSDLLAEFEAENDAAEASGPGEVVAVIDHEDAAEPEPVSAAAQLGLEDDTEVDFLVGDDAEPEPEPISSHPPPATNAAPAPTSAAALFADDDDAGAFDLGFSAPTTDPVPAPASPSTVPSLSIEHSRQPSLDQHPGDVSLQSMFTNESDWLGDTSIEESIRVDTDTSTQAALSNGAAANKTETAPWSAVTEDGNEPIQFEVPQGWYDDNNEWHWYTDEERDQVRLAMMGQSTWEDSQPQGKIDIQPPVPLSENAARRTPVPPDTATMPTVAQPSQGSYFPMDAYAPAAPATSAYDPYSPANAYSPAAYTPASTYTPAATGYAQQAASYANTYDPYARSPYAPSQKPAPVAGGSQRGPMAPPSKPVAPKRMASNAYDPPFLKPQKSFVRPASVTPAPITGFSPAASVSPLPAAPPVAAPPPPPPSGPPRRSKTPAATTPAYAPPPPAVPAIPIDGITQTPHQPQTSAYDTESSYDPSAQPLSYKPPTSHQPSLSPPSGPPRPPSATARGPPPKPSYSSFDPPLRPPSTTQRATSRPAFASPPARTVTPPTMTVTPPPPPSASLGPQRHGSPFGEEKFAPPRVSSPLKPRGSLGTPYDDHREARQERAHEWGGEEDTRPYETQHEDPEGGSGQWGDEPEYSKPKEATGYEPYQPSTESSGYEPYQPSTEQRAVEDPYALSSSLGLHHNDTYEAPSTHDSYAPPSSQDSYAPHTGSTYQPYPDYTPQQTDSSRVHATPAAQVSRQSIPSYEPSTLEVPPSSSSLYAPSNDPYGRAASPAYSSEYGVSPPAPNYFQSMTASMDPTYVPQQVLDQRPISEDPLGRCTMAARNAPIAIFGFNGQIITAFPGISDPSGAEMSHSRTPSYGYASGRGQLWIRSVSEVVEGSALKSNEAVFPGPLVLDPSAAKGAAAEKKRREAVIAYLEARADELERGLPYLKSSASHARRETEGKLVVVRLLAAMVHGDGKIFGNAKAEEAVHAALATPSTSSPVSAGGSTFAAPVANGFSNSYTTPLVSQPTHSVAASPAHLEQLSKLLLLGDKRGAAGYAADAGLWSHALVISSSVDPELWKEVVTKFAAAEMGTSVAQQTAAMKAAYSLFAGHSTSLVDELMSAANITDDPSNDQWREVLSAVISNGKPTDLVCLDELGNRLARLSLINAAQACYLLSANSPFTDVSPGAQTRQVMLVEGTRDEDGVIFAEVAEYARSLVPTPKGVEPPFPGLPQLLPYKLDRAWRAAEVGDTELAKKYCHAIDAASKPGKNARSVLPRHLSASMDDLLERLTGTPSADPATGIGGRRRAKSGATIGSWIEGRLTKFIAGDDEPEDKATKQPATTAATGAGGKNPPAPVVGPFSHFSTISPAPSAGVSRVASTVDVTQQHMYGGLGGHLGPHDSMHSHQAAGAAGHLSGGSYGDQYNAYGGGGGGYTPWGMSTETVPEGEQEDTASYEPYNPSEGDLINPMAQLSLGEGDKQEPQRQQLQPPSQPRNSAWGGDNDDDDDLGFGNSSLSRARTPAVPAEGAQQGTATPDKKAEAAKAAPADSPKGGAKDKAGWFGSWGWGGKKGAEGGSGPVRANLGEATSMVYDPELKRWVMPGANGTKTVPTPPAPPSRAQTASPSRSMRPGADAGSAGAHAMSATPPPSQRPPSGPPGGGGHPPRMASAPSGMPRTSLSESFTASDLPSGVPGPRSGLSSGPGSGASTPASGPPPMGSSGPIPPRAAPASLDDLLSRPSSKRPASAMKKGARNRYVDVFQQPEAS